MMIFDTKLNGEANLNRFSAVLAYKYKKFWVIETDTIKIRKQQSTASRIVVFFFFDKAREKKYLRGTGVITLS